VCLFQIDVDLIYVLDKGVVVESGTHSELMSDSSSRYFKMWEFQSSQAETKQTGGVLQADNTAAFVHGVTAERAS